MVVGVLLSSFAINYVQLGNCLQKLFWISGLNTLNSKPRKTGSQSSTRSQSNLLTAFSSFPVVSALSKLALHRPIEGTIKTVTVSMTPSGKYYASVLTELEGDKPVACTDGKVAGIDLGLKDFAVVNDGIRTSKYPNLKHLAKHERHLKRKQQKLARKEKGSKSRNKARKLAARVYERISNVRQDYSLCQKDEVLMGIGHRA